MKVYLAGPYSARNILREAFLASLESHSHECTSSWLMEDHPITSATVGAATGQSVEYLAKHVMGDIHDVTRSDALVLLTGRVMEDMAIPGPHHTGGRHVETGIALASQLPVIVYGPPENIFHRSGVYQSNTWIGVLDILAELEQNKLRSLMDQIHPNTPISINRKAGS